MSITKKYFSLPILFLFLLTFSIAGCSGGGGGGSNGPLATTLSVNFGLKQLLFSWPASDGATHYKLLENPDGASGFSQVGANISGTSVTIDIPVHLKDWANAQYILQACNDGGCSDSNQVSITSGVLSAIGYFKSGNTITGDQFGFSISLSDDGNTLAVGSQFEGSNEGAVYVYNYDGSSWSPYLNNPIKGNDTDADDAFGYAVSLSGDGNTLAVGATGEGSDAFGMACNSDTTDTTGGPGNTPNGIPDCQEESNPFPGDSSGAVYVFSFDGTNWNQQAYIKASNAESQDLFGTSVSLSDDGNTLGVGTYWEDGNAQGMTCNSDTTDVSGVNGIPDCQEDNSQDRAGAVYVFSRTGSDWSQQAYVKASNAESFDRFGISVSLSSDGNTMAVGASTEWSNATGIDGNQADNSSFGSGAVYVFSRSGSTWSQQSYIKASNSESIFDGAIGEDRFGISVSLSADGNTLAVGSNGEDSNAVGMDCDADTTDINTNNIPDCQENNSALTSGAVYMFSYDGMDWSQQAYIKASNAEGSDQFGTSVSLSGDGSTLAAGANLEDSIATGIDGDQSDVSALSSGAVYVFTYDGSNWSQKSYVKASNTDGGDEFGTATSLDNDGSTLAVGANLEDGNTTGIGGNQDNDTATDAGAVYLY